MSRTISFRGKLAIGEQDRISLKTNNGKTGYKITKFQILSTLPGAAAANEEMIAQIYSKDQTGSISSTVDFTDADLLAVAYQETVVGAQEGLTTTILFDNAKFNQDIFVNVTDASGGTTPVNYYIELETMKLSDLEATMLTLQSLRTISE